jgi:hypothetical protein
MLWKIHFGRGYGPVLIPCDDYDDDHNDDDDDDDDDDESG